MFNYLLRCLDTLIFIILNTRENVILHGYEILAHEYQACETYIYGSPEFHRWLLWICLCYCPLCVVHEHLKNSWANLAQKFLRCGRDLIWGNDCKNWHISLSNLLYFQELHDYVVNVSKDHVVNMSKKNSTENF